MGVRGGGEGGHGLAEKRQAGARVRTFWCLEHPVVSVWPMGSAEGLPDNFLAPMWVNSH